jgi:His-Xaa-Ser system protein HxsD
MVISKVCYWLTEDYTVCREYIADSIHRLTIEPKNGIVDNSHFDNLRHKISQLLADYKLREIILMETKDIRNILYIKAFANNDEFEDYNLEL